MMNVQKNINMKYCDEVYCASNLKPGD